MSQYLNFFIKTDKNKYQQIASYSRNHRIYQAFNSAPYEKITRLTESKIINAIEELETARDAYQKIIQDNNEQIAIQYHLWSKDELFDIYDRIQQINKELKQDIEDSEKSLIELQFIHQITRISNNAIIYFGVEIYDPKDKDII